MLRLIINCFKSIIFLIKQVSYQTNKNLDQAADSMVKHRKISKDKSLQYYKKEKAQMVIDGDYESEDTMDNDLERLEAQILGKK